ncbi:MAG: hypothetical protein ACFE94_19130 [Candidatus Hodarchaeota archaeon]
MKLRKNMEGDSRPINLVLLAVSFIIFGVLGIVFMTQMDNTLITRTNNTNTVIIL